MEQYVNRVDVDGTITKVCEFINVCSPRFNLQSYIMGELWKNHNDWDESARKKADALIKEGRGYYMYEDKSGVVYTIRKNPDLELAIEIAELLKSCDFEIGTIYKCSTPGNIIRWSPLVEYVVNLSTTDCVVIEIRNFYDEKIGFFAVLNDGRILSGGNDFISDGFISIASEKGVEMDKSDFNKKGWKVYDNPFSRDFCIICKDFKKFKQFIKKLQ